jgi:hypothetical protein
MNCIQRRFASVLFFVLFTGPGTGRAWAEPVAAEEARAVRAFSFAAPSIRTMFQTPDRFMEMVRKGYPVIYRAATVLFLDPERIQGELLQGVRLTDADGNLWLATYRLERQPDKRWRISGCDVQPSSGKMT